jgi:HK97 family phage portal protein
MKLLDKIFKTGKKNSFGAGISYVPGMFLMNPNTMQNDYNLQDYWQPSYQWMEYQCKDIIYTCLHLRASNVAKAEPVLYQRVSQTRYKPVYNFDNAVVRLLDEPQKYSDITWSDLLYKSQLNKDALGNAYWYFKRSKTIIHPDTGLGIPEEAFVLDVYENSQMIPIYDSNNNLIKYDYYPKGRNNSKEGKITYEARDIVVMQYPSLDNSFYGKGILGAGADLINTKNIIKDYQQKGFKFDFPQKLLLETESEYNLEYQKIYEEQFKRNYGGMDSENSVIILWGGLKGKQMNFSPKESDYLETLKFNLIQILGMFQIPPTMVSINENANRALDTNGYRNFLNFMLHSQVVKYDNKMSKFFQKNFDRSLYIEHKLKMPTDEKLELEKVRVGGTLGIIKVNEGRDRIGFDEALLPDGSPDPKGEEYIATKNDVPADTRPNDGLNQPENN